MGSAASVELSEKVSRASREELQSTLKELIDEDRVRLQEALDEAEGVNKLGLVQDQTRTNINYDIIDSLWDALEPEDVVMMSGLWLMNLGKNNGILGKRQECPPDAFLPLNDLKQIHDNSNALPPMATEKRAPIVAISHFWRTKAHPDPCSITLRHVSLKLEEQMAIYKTEGVKNVGLFFDWVSLYQEPRDPREIEAFKRSLKFINLWYAHALTTVYLVTDTPKELTPYHDRGWTSFEYNLSWMIKLSDRYNVWSQVQNLGVNSQRKSRPGLLEPDAFKPGHLLGDKIFTNGSDRGKVAIKFRETCDDVFGSSTELDYTDLGWTDAEMKGFSFILPLCRKLRKLALNRNPFKSLHASFGQLPALEEFSLWGCTSLISLPESIGHLKALQKLDLYGCKYLSSLPASLCNLQELQFLNLRDCGSLKNLPEDIGDLQALQVLNLQRCNSLTKLPNSIGRMQSLQTLDLSSCSSLSIYLPEGINQLKCNILGRRCVKN